MPPWLNTLVKSRRFWATVASLVLVVGRDKLTALGLDLTDEQVTQAVIAIGAWIAGESLRSSAAVSQKAGE